MIIKLNRSVRQLCLSLTRQDTSVPAVLCRTGQPPCCTATGNPLVLTIARRDCPDTFWQPALRVPCDAPVVSPCGCMQDIVGIGYRPAIELAVADWLTGDDWAGFWVPDCLDGPPASLSAAGIRISCWHFGHLPDLPAMLSGTFKLCPHWQVTRIGMLSTFVRKILVLI